MKPHPTSRRFRSPSWRSFDRRDGYRIEARLRTGDLPCCPLCGIVLEARPETRLGRVLVLDATGYDLDCRGCRRFWCIVQHTPRSLRLIRMRRFAAAVRAASRAAERSSAPLREAGYSAVA